MRNVMVIPKMNDKLQKFLDQGCLSEFIFYQYDGLPILFVGKTDDNIKYLISNCKLGELYVITEVSNSALLSLMDNQTPIRDIFTKNLKGFHGVTWNGKRFHVLLSHYTHLTDWLPRPGAKLDLPKEVTQSYYDLLKSEL